MNPTLRHLAAVVFALVALTAHAAQAAEPSRNLAVAATEKRVALVIGNSDYKSGPLVNPVNDARAVAAKLRSLGFTVQLKENMKAREIGGVYREFRNLVTPGSVALVFYAGHGVQFKGQNYFPAVDSDISSEEDVPLQSLNLGTLLDNMEEAKAGVSLVLLDACRDNPFARRFRSASRGLAKVEAASGTLIHYATKPGSVASDGDGRNGTYTEALLVQMDVPGVPIELMLKQVTNQVVGKTQGKQEPWVEGSLRGNFFFRPGDGTQVAQLGPGIGGHSRTPEQIEDELWDAIRNDDKPRVFEAYIREYPKGRYLAQARVKLSGLKDSAKPLSAPLATRDDPDTALWKAVEHGGSADEYEVYLRQYPKGRFAALAKQRLQKMKADSSAAGKAKDNKADASARPSSAPPVDKLPEKLPDTTAEVDMHFPLLARAGWQEALDYFQRAVTARPDDVNVRAGLAVALVIKGDEEGARYNGRRIRDMNPETRSRWARLAVGLSDGLGQDYEGGKYQLNRASEDGADKALVNLSLALVHQKHNRSDLAETVLENYRAIVPEGEQGSLAKDLAAKTHVGTRLAGTYYFTKKDKAIVEQAMQISFQKNGNGVTAAIATQHFGSISQQNTVSNLVIENSTVVVTFKNQATSFWSEYQVSGDLKGDLREIPVAMKQIGGNVGTNGTLVFEGFLIRK